MKFAEYFTKKEPNGGVMDWNNLDPPPRVPFDEYTVSELERGNFLIVMLDAPFNSDNFFQYSPYYVAFVERLELK